MCWSDAELKKRIGHVVLLWLNLVCLEALLLICLGDRDGVRLIHQASWIAAHIESIQRMSAWGNYPFYLLFLGMLCMGWFRNQPQLKVLALAYLMAQLVGAVVIVRTLKVLLGRARPNVCEPACEGSTWIGPSWNDAFNSFPSGHMADSLTNVMFAALLFRGILAKVLLFAWAAAMGLMRIALSKHYPSDVLAGTLIGGSVSLATLWVSMLPKSRSAPLLR
jgi:membrane-associated phospholipid phosphatase